jgi:hypothetical protein
VRLPLVGDAVRLRYLDSARDANSGQVLKAVVFQWLVPVPGTAKLAVLSFATPNTDEILADSFAELFAAIASSLDFLNNNHRLGQPSRHDSAPSRCLGEDLDREAACPGRPAQIS